MVGGFFFFFLLPWVQHLPTLIVFSAHLIISSLSFLCFSEEIKGTCIQVSLHSLVILFSAHYVED